MRGADRALTPWRTTLTGRLASRNPLVITGCALNGGLVFAGQLLPRLPFALGR